ncbi:hypothetical protein QFI91_20030 [Raoultella sp. WB_B2P2-3]|uniref:hypothetical protein n=1 Tax=Raoultella scottii TaxID=3040937 RepID=UPI002F9492F9
MSQDSNRSFINGFSEKEQKIVSDIKDVDDVLCENDDFNYILDDYFIKIKNYFSDYINIPSHESLLSYSLDDVLSDFINGVFSNPFFEYMSSCAERMCEELGCSFKLYGSAAFTALWFAAKGDYNKSEKFIIICFQPIMSMVRMSEIPRNAGRLGGRPEHPLKAETIKLARHKWNTMEYASLNIVATAVKHQLEITYKSPPSLPSIKKWITSANIRPQKSNK